MPDAWSPAAGYELTVDGQPTLMAGTTTVRIWPGEGVGEVTGAPPLTAPQGVPTWQGTPSDRAVLHADVVPPARSVGRRIADFLNRPLLEWATDQVSTG